MADDPPWHGGPTRKSRENQLAIKQTELLRSRLSGLIGLSPITAQARTRNTGDCRRKTMPGTSSVQANTKLIDRPRENNVHKRRAQNVLQESTDSRIMGVGRAPEGWKPSRSRDVRHCLETRPTCAHSGNTTKDCRRRVERDGCPQLAMN